MTSCCGHRHPRIGVVLVLFALAAATSAAAQEAGLADLKVRVVRGEEKVPAAGVTIEVFDALVSQERYRKSISNAPWVPPHADLSALSRRLKKTWKTDEKGEATITHPVMNIWDQSVQITASTGSESGSVSMSRKTDPSQTLEILLKPKDLTSQSVSVVDEAGQGVPNVLIMAYSKIEPKKGGQGWYALASGYTGAKGEPAALTFNMSNMIPHTPKPEDKVQMVGYLCGTVLRHEMRALSEFGKKPITMEAPSACSLEFEVVDDRGKVIKETLFGCGDVQSPEQRKSFIKYKDRGFIPSQASGRRFMIVNGHGVLDQVAEREAVSVTIWQAGARHYKTASQVVQSPRAPGESAKIRFVLDRRPYLKLRVTDKDGKPMKHSGIHCRIEDRGHFVSSTAVSNARGEIRIFLKSLKGARDAERTLQLAYWHGFGKRYSRAEVKVKKLLKKGANNIGKVKLVPPKIMNLSANEEPQRPFEEYEDW